MRRVPRLIATVLVAVLQVSALAAAAEPDRDRPTGNGDEQVPVEEPSFPETFFRDRVRLSTNVYVAPSTDFDGQDLGLTRTELRLRARVPIGNKLSVQLSAHFRTSFYDEDGDGSLFQGCIDCPSPERLYATSLGLEGGYLLNRRWAVFRADELWAVVGGVHTSARWEPGAFNESLTPGAALGLGYQLPDRIRVALGARVARALDGDGVTVGPFGYLRWNLTPQLELQNRGLGLQLGYRPTTRWELFVAGFRSSDRFRMDSRPGAPSGVTFSDRQIDVGGGVTLKAYKALRVTVEAGAIVDREIAMDARDGGELESTNGDVSPYFSLRLELRP